MEDNLNKKSKRRYVRQFNIKDALLGKRVIKNFGLIRGLQEYEFLKTNF